MFPDVNELDTDNGPEVRKMRHYEEINGLYNSKRKHRNQQREW